MDRIVVIMVKKIYICYKTGGKYMRSVIINKNRYNHKGLKIGYWENYYLNGNLHWKGSFINGIKDGLWEYYKESGELEEIKTYKEGHRV